MSFCAYHDRSTVPLILIAAIDFSALLSAPAPAWSQPAACIYVDLEYAAEAKRVEGRCGACDYKCGFLEVILQSRDILSIGRTAPDTYPERFPHPPAKIAAAAASIDGACQLAAFDPPVDREALSAAADELFDSISSVAEDLVAGLNADPPEDETSDLAATVERYLASVNSARTLVNAEQCQPAATEQPAETTPPAAGPTPAPAPTPAPP